MWDWLKGFDLRRWWIGGIAVGVVIAVAGVAAKDGGATTLVGLGVLIFGFGEWTNHRMETEIRRDGTLTTFERKNRTLGITMDLIGVLLFILGILPAILRAWELLSQSN